MINIWPAPPAWGYIYIIIIYIYVYICMYKYIIIYIYIYIHLQSCTTLRWGEWCLKAFGVFHALPQLFISDCGERDPFSVILGEFHHDTGSVFFSYIGFDVLATLSAEAGEASGRVVLAQYWVPDCISKYHTTFLLHDVILCFFLVVIHFADIVMSRWWYLQWLYIYICILYIYVYYI